MGRLTYYLKDGHKISISGPSITEGSKKLLVELIHSKTSESVFTVDEYDDKGLLQKVYKYSFENFDDMLYSEDVLGIVDDGYIDYTNGERMSVETFNFLRSMSMEMAAITGDRVPDSIMYRVLPLLMVDHWYQDNSFKDIVDTIAFDVYFVPNLSYKCVLGIWFGFINVKEEKQERSAKWKFSSVFMHSTISKQKKIFGRNTFKDSDFEKIAPRVGFEGSKNILNLADKTDDDAIANLLGLKKCRQSNIFQLCNDARHGRRVE